MECIFCEWRCNLSEDAYGVCRMYYEHGGEIRERFPNRWSYAVSRIESLPFYHAYPGSRTLTIGTRGCNFNCRYCSNAYIALEDPETLSEHTYEMTAEELAGMAKKLNCHNIVFNVNEPTVSLPDLLRLKTAAHEAGLPMGCLTNAYGTEESTELLASVFDFINIGLKGFSSAFYRDYIGVKNIEPIVRNIRALAGLRHVEVTTPVIQGVNDGDLDRIVEFLADIDPEIPWHVFRLLPEYDMKSADYPSIEQISHAVEAARKKLKFVYFHNFVGSDWVNTACPHCGMDVIERFSLGCGGDRLDDFHCVNNQCPRCGCTIKMHGRYIPLPKETRVTV
jgi:pyruvate formate lyase activating enzyme